MSAICSSTNKVFCQVRIFYTIRVKNNERRPFHGNRLSWGQRDSGLLSRQAIQMQLQDVFSLTECRKSFCMLKKMTDTPPCQDDPAELSADKGYHSREILKDLDDSPWKTRIAEPKPKGLCDWKSDHEARRAVYNNRRRTSSGIGKHVSRLRTEIVERSFQHILDRGGMRRVWLRGLENVQKRYLIHVAGYNLGILMRKLIGYGTPKGRPRDWALQFQ